MGLFTLVSSAVHNERQCIPRRRTEDSEKANRELVDSNSCSIPTSDSIYTLSILGIVELLIGFPIILGVLFILFINISNKIKNGRAKYIDYTLIIISLFVTIGGFIFAIYTDAHTIDIYIKQKSMTYDNGPLNYIYVFCALIVYYIIFICIFLYVNKNNIGRLSKMSM